MAKGRARLNRILKRELAKIPQSNLTSDVQKPRVVIAIPCGDAKVRIEFALALRVLGEPLNMPWALRTHTGDSVAVARNVLAKVAIEEGAEFVFFLDDDVLLPPGALQRMLFDIQQRPMCDVLTGIVTTKTDLSEPVIFNDPEGEYRGAFWDWKFNDVFEITSCGMPATLIRTRIFEKIEFPWFVDTRLRNTGGVESEDRYFCRRVREAGGHIFAHGGVLCGHMDRETGKLYQISPETQPFAEVDTSKLARAS
jgi:hypothetical protein